MKSCTDLEQSLKLLALGIPAESADMWWDALNWQETEFYVEVKQEGIKQPKKAIPCWSLAALLELMPKIHGLKPMIDTDCNDIYYSGLTISIDTDNYDTLIDAAYNMIIWLKEHKYI